MRAYKNLEQAERAFGSLKGPDLQIRPIHHRLDDRVRAHVLICMLAYYLTWHLKAAWKPLLFTDEHRPVEPRPGRESRPLPRRTTESANETHPQRAARAQLPHAPRRTRDPDPEHHPPHGLTPARSRSSPSRPRYKPKRSISPRNAPVLSAR